jgi:hypothetical protein
MATSEYPSCPSDKTALGTESQSSSGNATTEFYVYFVDGDATSTNSGYYVVVVVQSSGFQPGSPLAHSNNDANSSGWFQYMVELQGNQFLSSAGESFGSALQLQYSLTTVNDSGDGVPASV